APHYSLQAYYCSALLRPASAKPLVAFSTLPNADPLEVFRRRHHWLKMSLMTKMSLKKELLHLPLVLLAKSPVCSSEESADVNNSRDRWMWFYRAPRRRRTSCGRLSGPRP